MTHYSSTTTTPHLSYCPDCEYIGGQPDTARELDRVQAPLTTALVATVVFLTAIAPLPPRCTPTFPRVAADLSGTATKVQPTVTTFFVVSDQRGRRRPAS
jgi:DHA1 family bicyclomycin/chloramphenicol resistance-like MFS transporter